MQSKDEILKLKCRFCSWETPAWRTTKSSKKHRHGWILLEKHVFDNHPEETGKLLGAGISNLAKSNEMSRK